MKRKLAIILIKILKKVWFFYSKKIRFYQVEYYLNIDVSEPLPSDSLNILAKCCQTLNSCKISYSLGWGTALGIHRDGKLIAHDNDLDLDIFDYPDYQYIIEIFNNIGLRLARKVVYRKMVQQLIFLSDNGVIIDLVFWRKKTNNYISDCEPGYVLKLPKELVEAGTSMIKFNEFYFQIWSSVDKYLEAIYGLDWRIPKDTKGDWKSDCKILSKKIDPSFYLYQKISPIYRKLKNRLNLTLQIPEIFFALNKKFWPTVPSYDKYFLVDLAIHDHEYYNVHLITARALSEILKAKPVALLHQGQNGEVEKLVRSYGIDDVIYLEKYNVTLLKQLNLLIKSIYWWLINRTKDSLLKIQFNKITIGHLIYDEYLRCTLRGTVKMWDPTLIIMIFRSLKYYYKYTNIFSDRKYELYFGVEQVYARSGMASVAAISKGIEMLLRKYGPNQVAYKSYFKASDLDLFSSHPEKEDFEYQLKYNKQNALNWSSNYIKNLFSGNVEKYDWNAKNAYATSQRINPKDYQKIFEGDYHYRVFIFSHVFTDAVHCYRQGIFPDYEVWLEETLKIASKRTDTLWIVKPHPSDKFYPTKHTSLSVYKKFKKYHNIKLFPENTSSANLVDKIDAVLTFRGTAAGEYSCLGIPAITAGRSMFDEGNFCFSPKNRDEYKEILLNYQFKRLPDETVDLAKVYLYVYNYVNRIDMPLLEDIILSSADSASPKEIYNHLIKKISKYNNDFSFPDNYIKYIMKKLKVAN